MRLLLIEDDEDQAEVFAVGLAARTQSVELAVAGSRDAAIEALATTFFDLVVCDLKIPTMDGALDPALEHGIDVQRFITEELSGTPTIFFSAFGVDLVLDRHVIPFAAQGDPFMTGREQPMLAVRDKLEIARCLDEIASAAESVLALDRIALDATEELDEVDARLIRLVVRRVEATHAEVEVFPGACRKQGPIEQPPQPTTDHRGYMRQSRPMLSRKSTWSERGSLVSPLSLARR